MIDDDDKNYVDLLLGGKGRILLRDVKNFYPT